MDESEDSAPNNAARRLLEDAALLYAAGRLPSTLLLLLCAIDALAPRIADCDRVAGRYISFLKDCLNDYPGHLNATRITGAGGYILEFPDGPNVRMQQVRVPGSCEMLDFARIIYTYLRNPMVHEGQTLDVEGSGINAYVRLDFNDVHLVSRTESEFVIVGAPWLVKQLFVILSHKLGE